jgi:hypothetical protein
VRHAFPVTLKARSPLPSQPEVVTDREPRLGLIVLVRTFLSFSLEIELEGPLPWRRGSTKKRPDPAISVGNRPT